MRCKNKRFFKSKSKIVSWLYRCCSRAGCGYFPTICRRRWVSGDLEGFLPYRRSRAWRSRLYRYIPPARRWFSPTESSRKSAWLFDLCSCALKTIRSESTFRLHDSDSVYIPLGWMCFSNETTLSCGNNIKHSMPYFYQNSWWMDKNSSVLSCSLLIY